MKKKLAVFASVILLAITTHAQCEKPVKFKSARTEMINEKGDVVGVQDKATMITISDKHVTIVAGNENPEVIEGDVKSITCNWKELYKNGSSSFDAVLAKPNGDLSDANFLISGENGKLTITVAIARLVGKKMRLIVENIEETK